MDNRPPPALLVLELVGARAGTLGRESRCVFRTSPGTIGRAPDSTWVLPEAWVSSTHARIEFVNGGFLLTDVSSNGVACADPETIIEPKKPCPIRSGMRLLIGDYEIEATLLDENGLPLAVYSSYPGSFFG